MMRRLFPIYRGKRREHNLKGVEWSSLRLPRVRGVTRTALLLGALTALSGWAIGYFAYTTSRETTLKHVYESNLNLARTISAHALLPGRSGKEVLGELERFWGTTKQRYRGSYLCVVGPSGQLLIHTARPERVGTNVGAIPIDSHSARDPKNLRELVEAKQEWAGYYTSPEGQKQVAAFVYVDRLNALVGVHVPSEEIEAEIRASALPWAVGVVFISVVLLPLSLGLLHWGYTASDRAAGRAMAALRESEGRLRAIFENSAIGIALTDLAGRFVVTNRAYQALLGYSDDELRQLSCSDLTLEEFFEANDRFFTELKEGKRLYFQIEKQYRRGNGNAIWVRDTVSLVPDPEGKPQFAIALIEDITERKRAEEALVKAEFQYRQLVESVSAVVWLADAATFQFSFVSKEAEALLGYPVERWTREPTFWNDHTHPDDREWTVAFCAKATQEKRSHEFEYRMIAADGRVVWLRDIARVIVENDRAKELIGVMVDITEKKRAEEAVRRSEEKYRQLMEQASDGILISDREGNYVEGNSKICELLGHTREELLTLNVKDLVQREDLLDTALRLDDIREGKTVLCERRLTRKDGTLISVEISAKMLEDGRVQAFIRDITERKRAEEALKARARQQAAVAELGQRALAHRDLSSLMNDAVTLIAQTFEVEYCKVLELSPDGQALLLRAGVGWRDGLVGQATVGTERDSQAGYTLLSNEPVIVEDLRAETRFSGPPLLHDHQVVSGLSAIIHGQDRPWGVLGAHTKHRRQFTKDDAHFLQAVANVLAAAIERKRTEEALLQSEKLAAMGQLLAGVAHELNNPLSVVMGQTFLLRQMDVEGPVAERFEKIAKAAERCMRIVKDFLALARQRPPKRQPTQLNHVVQAALELMAYSLRVDTVEVTLDLAQNLPILSADPHQLLQVVVNLIANAHQAMRKVSTPRRLTLTTRFDQDEQQVSLKVADSGPGFPLEIRSRIFEPFFTTKPVGEGTGLGLSLCKGIAERHGGTIRAESTPGQGAEFVVELPVEAPRRQIIVEARLPKPRSPIENKNILVVDDEPEVAGLLTDLLVRDGHHVEIAPNGAIALEKLRDRTFDLIVSDIRMPDLDGPGFYRELVERHPKLARRVIFVTGDVLGEEAQKFLEQTSALTLSKPFSWEEIQQVIRQTLEER